MYSQLPENFLDSHRTVIEFELSREKVEYVTECRSITLVELSVTTLIAGNRAVFFVLHIKNTRPETARYTDFTSFKLFT
jgi:hypothetical protein